MRICITLDDVLRAKTYQFGKIYKKYIDPSIQLDTLDMTSGDLCSIFKFKDKKSFEKFLYEDYGFEIFAEANTTEKGVDKKLILWQLEQSENDDLKEPIELLLANPMEFNASIGYSYFFISKLATRIREVHFPSDSQKIWDLCDVLITADPKLLENKPNGKTSIKIETDYNTNVSADVTYDKFSSFLNDKEIINKLQEHGEE